MFYVVSALLTRNHAASHSLESLLRVWERGRRSNMAPAVTFFMKRNCVSCRVVWLYLKQNKIPFTLVDVEESKTPELVNLGPSGCVPLLQDEDLSLYGSQAIIFYLAENFSSYAGFGKSDERPHVESVIHWAATTLLRDVGNNYVYPSLNRTEDALSKGANTSLVEFGKKEVIFHLHTLEKHYFSQHKFLCCAVPTLADSWTAIVLSLLELVGFDLSPWPRLKAWMSGMKSNSDYVDVSYSHEEMVRTSLYRSNSSTSVLNNFVTHKKR